MDKEDNHSSIEIRTLSVVGSTGAAGSTDSRDSFLGSTGSGQTDGGSGLHSVQTRTGGISGVSRMNRFSGPDRVICQCRFILIEQPGKCQIKAGQSPLEWKSMPGFFDTIGVTAEKDQESGLKPVGEHVCADPYVISPTKFRSWLYRFHLLIYPNDQAIPDYVQNRAVRKYLENGNLEGKVDLEEQKMFHDYGVDVHRYREYVLKVDEAWYGHSIDYPPKPFRP
jgi:hypothetical protein